MINNKIYDIIKTKQVKSDKIIVGCLDDPSWIHFKERIKLWGQQASYSVTLFITITPPVKMVKSIVL